MDSRTKWTPDGDADTPYARARQEWDARMGSAVVAAKNWRLSSFASLGLVLLSVAGMIYLGSRPRAVPHIIQIDAIGAPSYLGPVGQAASQYVPSDATLKYHLRRFLEDVRTLSSDAAVLKRNWLDAYTLVTPRGANMLSAYVAKPENDPFKRAATERATIEVASMVRVSADTWQIDWRETGWDKGGAPAASAVWRGMFRVIVQPPKTEEAMVKNPIGLYIDEFHWDKVQG
jgi:type IV secretory pathway TrbF-like protein